MNSLAFNDAIVLTEAELAAVIGGEWSWTALGASTVAGAAGGAAAGAVAGAMVGGIGAAPGAGVGAVSGAVGGAVTYAAYEAYMWMFG